MQDWVSWLSWESLEKKSFGFRFVTKTKLLSTFQSLHLENLWSSAASFLMSYHKYLHLDLWTDSLKLGKTRLHTLKVKFLVSFIKCTRAVSPSFQCYFQSFFLKMVFCYQNCSDLLWEKKNYSDRGWKQRICKNFEITKGQLISKANCQAVDSSKKRMKNLLFLTWRVVT